MINHTSELENLEDEKAERREKKKRPRMKKHGVNLKKSSIRGILRIHKVKKKSRDA